MWTFEPRIPLVHDQFFKTTATCTAQLFIILFTADLKFALSPIRLVVFMFHGASCRILLKVNARSSLGGRTDPVMVGYSVPHNVCTVSHKTAV